MDEISGEGRRVRRGRVGLVEGYYGRYIEVHREQGIEEILNAMTGYTTPACVCC